ncbi:MAG: T9SS type A sorting domain-containing protein [Owenweeksia sp.]|nr:T9SS type A sorting domain-containing protein [Owenweeksia sp.]
MKKGILLSIFSIFSLATVAQSLAIVEASSDTLSVGNATTSRDLESYVAVENVGSQAIQVLVKRINKNYTPLTDSNAICWQICFAPDVSQAPHSTAITLSPGQVSAKSDFVGHVYPDRDGTPYTGDITYVFFDLNNPSDSVAHTVSYEVNNTFAVAEIDVSRLVNVYPNPAQDNVTIDYDLQSLNQASFELINVVGNKVYQKELNAGSGELKLSIDRLPRGVYFYLLRNEGETLLTRKLVIE